MVAECFWRLLKCASIRPLFFTEASRHHIAGANERKTLIRAREVTMGKDGEEPRGESHGLLIFVTTVVSGLDDVMFSES
jgi:hypothetical protein